jgi:hypothetical protein
VLHGCGAPERHQALRALKCELIAQLCLQLLGIDADRLGVGIDGFDGHLEGVDRYDVAYTAGERTPSSSVGDWL